MCRRLNPLDKSFSFGECKPLSKCFSVTFSVTKRECICFTESITVCFSFH